MGRHLQMIITAVSSLLSLGFIVWAPEAAQRSHALLPMSSEGAAVTGLFVASAMLVISISSLLRDAGSRTPYFDRRFTLLYPLKALLLMLKLIVQMTPQLSPIDQTECKGNVTCIATDNGYKQTFKLTPFEEEDGASEMARTFLAITSALSILAGVPPMARDGVLGLAELRAKHIASPVAAVGAYLLVLVACNVGLASLLVGAVYGPESLLPDEVASAQRGSVYYYMQTYDGSAFSDCVMSAVGLSMVMVLANTFVRAAEKPSEIYSAAKTADGLRSAAALAVVLGLPGTMTVLSTPVAHGNQCTVRPWISGLEVWDCKGGDTPSIPIAAYIASWCGLVVSVGSFILASVAGDYSKDLVDSRVDVTPLTT